MSVYTPLSRLRRLRVGVAVLTIVSAALVAHGLRRQAAARDAEPAQRELVEALGFADLALSSGARWIRHPSQVELTAAVTDLPAALDMDPAGALVGPPLEAR